MAKKEVPSFREELRRTYRQMGFDFLLVKPDENTLEVVLIYQNFQPIDPTKLRAYSDERIEDVENLGGEPPKTQKFHIKDGWILLRTSRKAAPRHYLSEFKGKKYDTHGEQTACDAIFGHYHFEEI